MEPLTIFAAAVAFIGIFHLLSTAVDYLGQGRKIRTASAETRSDWYCFFKTSDLYGEDKKSAGTRENDSAGKRDDRLIEQRRRQEANRPRLHA